MANSTRNTDFRDPLRNIGPDSTADFDESPSNPTEYASSENLGADLDDDAYEEGDEDEDMEEEGLDDNVEDEDEDQDDDDDEEEDVEDEDELRVSERR